MERVWKKVQWFCYTCEAEASPDKDWLKCLIWLTICHVVLLCIGCSGRLCGSPDLDLQPNHVLTLVPLPSDLLGPLH